MAYKLPFYQPWGERGSGLSTWDPNRSPWFCGLGQFEASLAAFPHL
jgi:hypothetical protein